jgi:hypothetical protein
VVFYEVSSKLQHTIFLVSRSVSRRFFMDDHPACYTTCKALRVTTHLRIKRRTGGSGVRTTYFTETANELEERLYPAKGLDHLNTQERKWLTLGSAQRITKPCTASERPDSKPQELPQEGASGKSVNPYSNLFQACYAQTDGFCSTTALSREGFTTF